MSAWRSNVRGIGAQLERAERGALLAAVTIPFNVVRERLSGAKGYTSGDFSQGMDGSAGLLAKTDPEREAGGALVARYGFQAMPIPYPLYWELGHLNIFIVDWVRVPIVVPAAVDNAERITDAYVRTARRLLGGRPSPPPPLGGALDVAAD